MQAQNGRNFKIEIHHHSSGGYGLLGGVLYGKETNQLIAQGIIKLLGETKRRCQHFFLILALSIEKNDMFCKLFNSYRLIRTLV